MFGMLQRQKCVENGFPRFLPCKDTAIWIILHAKCSFETTKDSAEPHLLLENSHCCVIMYKLGELKGHSRIQLRGFTKMLGLNSV